MNITTDKDGNLIITGEMKTIEDYSSIKSALGKVIAQGKTSVMIEIRDSMTITSSIIGLFTKSVHGDGLKISLKVYTERLHNLLEDLNLIAVFNVTKV
ncbi:conserved hypothetical protein [Denitrovibrio acetiphilus DSM 12809]|uniref:STAS domain-containing protein n=1 Tax=Denitrovibrio acetiphilus (strain DSM 12809 / NBRC 114555 / N2460) TaxID=522772 RepID=D4H1L2_DENA2|nr:hypothetical protein [Denitrovibrio acetiphilus]ADD68772.1 conserved hypothetical protein [Denitrovibrio acetiphilus DSM 12809]